MEAYMGLRDTRKSGLGQIMADFEDNLQDVNWNLFAYK
jgi:hypothetical protein